MKTSAFNIILLTVLLIPFSCTGSISSTVLDIYNQPLEGVVIKVFHALDTSSENLLFESQTNTNGAVSIKHFDHPIQIHYQKNGYMHRSILFDDGVIPETVHLPPDQAGLYHEGTFIKKKPYEFEHLGMQGMMVPAYYDGTYLYDGTPAVVSVSDAKPLFLVADRETTLAMNVFKGKESLYLTPLQNNGTFAIYERGLKTTKKMDFDYEIILEDTDYSHTGLLETTLKVTKITDLPAEQYVIYIGGGNLLVNEPHPTEKSGCFPIKNVKTEYAL